MSLRVPLGQCTSGKIAEFKFSSKTVGYIRGRVCEAQSAEFCSVQRTKRPPRSPKQTSQGSTCFFVLFVILQCQGDCNAEIHFRCSRPETNPTQAVSHGTTNPAHVCLSLCEWEEVYLLPFLPYRNVGPDSRTLQINDPPLGRRMSNFMHFAALSLVIRMLLFSAKTHFNTTKNDGSGNTQDRAGPVGVAQSVQCSPAQYSLHMAAAQAVSWVRKRPKTLHITMWGFLKSLLATSYMEHFRYLSFADGWKTGN